MNEYKEFYSDIWDFHKNHLDVQNTKEWWRKTMDDARELIIKHGSTKFASSIIYAIVDEIERKNKETPK